jgi:adenylate cyclase
VPGPLPERPAKPSVAVLAFDNLSSDAEQDYFADGITEDVITELSRVPWLFVIARNSSFSYRGLAADVRRIGRELGVRYVLEGSVRRAGQRLRVTGQLIDAETGAHLWADHFDAPLEDVFDLQDRITAAVVGAIAPEIRNAEIERAARKRPDNLDAYDHFLRAQAAIVQFRLRDADRHLAEAIARSLNYAEPKALWAWLSTILWHPEADTTPERQAAACRTAEEVLLTPGAEIEAKAYAGYTIAFLTDEFDRGLGHVTRALELCPSCSSAWGSSCLLDALHGNTDVAIRHGAEALRLNPQDPMSFRVLMGMSHAAVIDGDWQRVLDGVERARPFINHVSMFRIDAITALVRLGRLDCARREGERLLAAHPGFTVGRVRENRSRNRAMTPAGRDPVCAALLAAGSPE